VLVDAWVGGIHAGDARRLSLEATFPEVRRMEAEHGSLLRALLSRRRRRAGGAPARARGILASFPEGMQELIEALARSLGSRLRLGAAVARISALGRRGYRLHLREGAPVDVNAVVLACPAPAAAEIVAALDREMADLLLGIRSAPLAVVHLGFRDGALGTPLDGFGLLVPRGQGPRTLGTLWSSSIFEGRAPAGAVLLTSLLGGACDGGAVHLDDAALLATAREDLRVTMGVAVDPYFVRIFRHPNGIAQYELGHVDRLLALERRRALFPGLWLTGSSLRGISVNACIGEAPRVAGEALAFLRGPRTDRAKGP
jgi:oxygen-dependent protoporphyrinogen oxidase